MNLQVQDMKYGDVEAYAETYISAFWGGHDEPADSDARKAYQGRVAGAVSRWNRNYAMPLSMYKKVVDTNTERLVSFIKFEYVYTKYDYKTLLPKDIPPSVAIPEVPLPEQIDEADTWVKFARARHRELGEKPSITICLLGTHPDAQGLGAARLLMTWLNDLADSQQLPCWVTANPGAVGIYTKFGFKIMDEIPNPHDNEIHTCMLRAPCASESLLK